ncbi:SHOCT domain-containing protein [Nonomuraea africana]|uniref:Membrane protein n=1 Tax=Nonomuraea africana TaxID=46171 RepID=A0ABR9K7E3_9ACTN|nr:SHOCT domain-containing protein [Nonomuraea africana]MBE1557726.1 putative membrane protein [Nonomuraea africana]
MIRLLVILLVIVIVVLVLMMIRMRPSAPKPSQAKSAQEGPREILKRRYAAGEIDEDEYLRRMSGLSQDW